MTDKERKKSNKRIFFSYAAADSPTAHKLQSILSKHSNLDVFTTETLSAGENWVSKLKSALSSCDIFLVLLSPSSINSNWVLYEVGAAWGLGKPIIPIIIDSEMSSNIIPAPLNQLQLVDFKSLEDPQALNQIFEGYEDGVLTQ